MKKIKWGIPLVAVLAVCLSIFPITASASSDRITQGEAQAWYNAGPSGASAILFRTGGHALGAFPYSGADIRPYFENGIHYCVLDWHMIGLIVYDTRGTKQEASASFEPLVLTFTLDGQDLATERTPVKAVSDPSFLDADKAFFVQQGTVLSPSDLTTGSHTLTLTSFNPANPDDNFTLESQFYVDAAGTGACI
jgi:hypothetical protein